jgi:hypothetical protein
MSRREDVGAGGEGERLAHHEEEVARLDLKVHGRVDEHARVRKHDAALWPPQADASAAGLKKSINRLG